MTTPDEDTKHDVYKNKGNLKDLKVSDFTRLKLGACGSCQRVPLCILLGDRRYLQILRAIVRAPRPDPPNTLTECFSIRAMRKHFIREYARNLPKSTAQERINTLVNKRVMARLEENSRTIFYQLNDIIPSQAVKGVEYDCCPIDVGIEGYWVLSLLAEVGSLPINIIAEEIGLSRIPIDNLVAVMVRKELVTYQTNNQWISLNRTHQFVKAYLQDRNLFHMLGIDRKGDESPSNSSNDSSPSEPEPHD